MARYSYSGNKKHKKKQNHASEYLPYIINELADEIEVVEQALSSGEEGQVLTADSAGKAKWTPVNNEVIAEVAFDGAIFTNLQIEDSDYYYWELTLTLKNAPIVTDVNFMAYLEDDNGWIIGDDICTIDGDGDYLDDLIINNGLYLMRYKHMLPEGDVRYIGLDFIADRNVRICIIMPNGKIFKSDFVSIQ